MNFNKYIFFNTTALKLALEKDNLDIYNYLLELPDIKIGYKCFSNSKKLRELTIPPSITALGDYSFENCINLKKIIIPSSIKTIGSYAFYNCKSLIEMIIPTSVASIGDNFITGCTSMENVVIPNDIQKIGILDFNNFTLLKEIIIPRAANPMIIDKAFYKCKSLTKIEIPTSITHIGKYAFYQCEQLKELTIPSTVKTIEFNAFKGCSSLKRITIEPLPSNIDEYTFAICTSLMKSCQLPDYHIDGNTIILDETYHDAVLPDPDKVYGPINIVIAGDSYVGKTCFLSRYVGENNNISSVLSNKINIIKVISGVKINIEINDTAGIHRLYSVTKLFFRISNCGIVMFDLTNIESLEYTRQLYNDLFEMAGEIPTILVGNKCDSTEERIDREKIDEISYEYESKYFEASASNNLNVKESFEYIIGEVFQKYYYDQIKEIKINNERNQNSKCNI